MDVTQLNRIRGDVVSAVRMVFAATLVVVVVAIGLVVAGVAVLAGAGWALIAAGVLLAVSAGVVGFVLLHDGAPKL